MIKTEFYKIRNDGIQLYKTYSDKNVYIKQLESDVEYSVAIDVYPLKYTYIETDKPLEIENI